MKFRIVYFIIFLFLSFSFHAQEHSSDILNESKRKATAENKHIFLKYSSSWCAWCKRLDQKMANEDCKDLFESNYVIIQLDVLETERKKHLENPGAFDLLKYHKGEDAGLPFWVILNSKGEILENSFNDKGENIGCPVSDDEVDYFISILKNTSNLSYNDLLKIAVSFRLD
jgi:thioredoxin-related protein